MKNLLNTLVNNDRLWELHTDTKKPLVLHENPKLYINVRLVNNDGRQFKLQYKLKNGTDNAAHVLYFKPEDLKEMLATINDVVSNAGESSKEWGVRFTGSLLSGLDAKLIAEVGDKGSSVINRVSLLLNNMPVYKTMLFKLFKTLILNTGRTLLATNEETKEKDLIEALENSLAENGVNAESRIITSVDIKWSNQTNRYTIPKLGGLSEESQNELARDVLKRGAIEF